MTNPEEDPARDEGSDSAADVRSFLIADVRGYTLFTAEHGDEAAAKLAARFAEVAREGVEARSGTVLELRGDEALCVFVSPRQAIRAAVDLQRRFAEETETDASLPLAVGIGLDAGEAVPLQGGYRGGALNTAARLCGQAGPGEILASSEIVHLAGRIEGIAYADRGPVLLKGLVEPVRVISVSVGSASPGAAGSAGGGAHRFVGRKRLAIGVVVAGILAGIVGLVVVLGGNQPPADEGPTDVAGDPIVCGSVTKFQVCRSDADGQGLVGLTDGHNNALNTSWSPDGQRLVYVSDEDGDSEIWVMGRDGSGRTQLTINLAQDYGPAWSRDGRIVFVSDVEGQLDLWIMDDDGEDSPRQLTDTAENEGAPAWSPDGSSVAYTLNRGGVQSIYTMAADGDRLPVALAVGSNPAWSTSGLVSFVKETNAGSEIFVVPADGSREPTRLTANRECDGFQAWSPDGTRIVFSSTRGGDDYDLFILDYDSEVVDQLVDTPTNDYRPVWSVSGQIAFETTSEAPADCTKQASG